MKVIVRRRWDTAEIGAKIEAFAVAGCDVVSQSLSFSSRTGHDPQSLGFRHVDLVKEESRLPQRPDP